MVSKQFPHAASCPKSAAWFSIGAVAAAALACMASAQAAEVVITPGMVSAVPVANQWYSTTSGGPSGTAAITTTNPRSGNGSVEMSLSNISGKADYTYYWGNLPGRTLSSLSQLSYDWYRDTSSTNSSVQQPAMRLLIDADGSAATTNDFGYLIWEQVYQTPGAVAAGTWVSSDILSGNFWQRNTSGHKTIEQYGVTLADWQTSPNYDGGLILSADTKILGIEFGIGGGWDGAFRGYVDNVSYGFGADATRFNFEADAAGAVPEPATLALVGLALLGVAAARRRGRG